MYLCLHSPEITVLIETIDNIRALLDWKLLSATVTIRASCPIMMEDLREDYKSILQDIFDSEKLKIDS